jgi:hypothetical protein
MHDRLVFEDHDFTMHAVLWLLIDDKMQVGCIVIGHSQQEFIQFRHGRSAN